MEALDPLLQEKLQFMRKREESSEREDIGKSIEIFVTQEKFKLKMDQV